MAEVCKANIGAAGRRRRKTIGWVSAAAAVGLVAAAEMFHLGWPVRVLVFFPAAMSAIGFLQATRNTCLAHASRGTIEHEDFSATPAPADEVAASRRVARTIYRDSLLIALAAAALAAASAWV